MGPFLIHCTHVSIAIEAQEETLDIDLHRILRQGQSNQMRILFCMSLVYLTTFSSELDAWYA